MSFALMHLEPVDLYEKPSPRCLSVKQPWASLIASGEKTIELRTWVTSYRGPLVICAGKGASTEGLLHYLDGPRGVALCIVDLVDCRPSKRRDTRAACCRAERNENAWVLENPRALPRIPILGSLGLFRPSGALLETLLEVLR